MDLSRASLLVEETLYSGRLVKNRNGEWMLLAFVNKDNSGDFVGVITDPMPVHWGDNGLLTVALPAAKPAG